MVTVRSRYAYENRPDVATSFVVKKDSKGRVLNPEVISLTNQSDADACDINKMFARFEKTGVLVDPTSGVSRTPVYGDFSGVSDFHDMQSRIAHAKQAFECLPASVRNRFDNDVQKLTEFLADPKNDSESVKLGLKDASVLLTALADDGVTKITQADRDRIDAEKAAAAKAAAGGASGTGTGSEPAGA